MIDHLESDLRAALKTRAGEVPAAAVMRVRGAGYDPRTHRIRPPVAIGALAAGAGAAGLATALVSLGGSVSNAFAGWTPAPTRASSSQVTDAVSDCRARLAAAPMQSVGGLPVALTDTRGPFTFTIFADQEASAACISGPGFTAISGSRASSDVTPPPGKVTLAQSHTSRDGQAYSFAEGRVGAGVTSATLELDNGSRVETTVGNGWFVAWWPGSADMKSVHATTANGVTTHVFDARGTPRCQVGASCSSQQGSVSGVEPRKAESGFSSTGG
jgi:hypothetical protein